MDIDLLRELVNVFKELGGEAKEAFVAYLIVTYVPGFLLGLVWTVGGVWAIHKAIELLRAILPSSQLLRAFGGSSVWSGGDLDKACEILREAKKPR